MKKRWIAFLLCCILLLTATAGQAQEKQPAEEHDFAVYVNAAGTVYDHFTITRLNCDENHQVQSVTGFYERTVLGEECEESDEAPESEQTYQLAQNFHAMMLESMYGDELTYIPVNDLYQWYIDAYIGRDNYDGHEMVFSADLTDEELETASPDFWFVTTQIQLNDQQEITYMEYVFVPWG